MKEKNFGTITPLPPKRVANPRSLPQLSKREIENRIENNCGAVYKAETHGNGRNKVYILPEAFQEFRTMVSYGRRSPMNKEEQKYIGMGHFFSDESGAFYIVVTHFIEIMTMNRSGVSAGNLGPNGTPNPGLDFLEYRRDEFLRNEKKYNTDAFGNMVDPLQEYGASEYVLEGHTHPGLGTFWSQTDKHTGSARAAKVPLCIFVCDPIRCQMLGSIGKTFEDAEVIVYDRVNDGVKVKNDIPSTADDIVRIANNYLSKKGVSGYIKCLTGVRGKVHMRMKLHISKGSKRARYE